MTDHESVRWGILGTARIAERVAKAIHAAPRATLHGIASRQAETAAAWAKTHDVAVSYAGYQSLLDDPEIDAVYIPLPPSMHREWTIKAAEAGKHVLCEKPLAMNVSETEEMADACRHHQVQLMDGVMWLHHPRAADMQRILQEQTLGTLRRVTSAFTFFGDQLTPGDLRYDRKRGGGSLGDLGWYCIGVTLWAFGSRPLSVQAHAQFQNDVDISLSALMLFSDDRVASFDCGFNTSMRRWVEIAGTQASLVCDDFTRPWHEGKPRFWIHDKSGKMAEHVSAAPIQEVCMIEDFCDIILSGRLDPAWPQRAIETQMICDALDRSARIGQPVTL